MLIEKTITQLRRTVVENSRLPSVVYPFCTDFRESCGWNGENVPNYPQFVGQSDLRIKYIQSAVYTDDRSRLVCRDQTVSAVLLLLFHAP